MELDGKVALITGASSGIGRETAKIFVREGARVMIVDRDAEGLEMTAAMLREQGGTVITASVDVTNTASIEAAVAQCVDEFGRLDVAHNNAGVTGPAYDFVDLPPEEAHRLMSVNYWGVFNCMQVELRAMAAQGAGVIINTASSASIVAVPNFAAYAASKHAVLGLTKTVAAEYAGRGIRVNAVCPGMVETPMTAEHAKDPVIGKVMRDMHPIGRFARADEVAEAVLWLASDRSSYAIGAALVLDGGYSLA